MKFIYIFLGIIFTLSALVQFNDPDPLVWITIYGVAALVSFLGIKHIVPWWVYLVLSIAYLVGSIDQWPPHFEGIFFNELAKMRNMNIEEARESLGLAICFVGMLWCSWHQKTTSPKPTRSL